MTPRVIFHLNMLSQKILHGGTLMSNALMSCFSHNNSYVTEAKALYLVSADDLESVSCFLDLQATKDSPMKIQNHMVDFLIVMQLPQSASKYVLGMDLQGQCHLHNPKEQQVSHPLLL